MQNSRVGRALQATASTLVLAGLWQIASLFFPHYLFPPVTDVVKRAVDIVVSGPLLVEVLVTAARIFAGLLGAFVLGAFEVPLAVGPNYPPTLAEYALQATQNDVLAGERLAAACLLLTAVAAIALAVLAVRFAKDAQGD